MGDKKLPGIAAEDIGQCAFGIFRAGNEFIGKTVGIAGEHLTGAEMAAELSEALGGHLAEDVIKRGTCMFLGGLGQLAFHPVSPESIQRLSRCATVIELQFAIDTNR